MSKFKHKGYPASHPWYYVLGGGILPPKAIRDETLDGNYGGYLEADIKALGNKPEPERSRAIEQMRHQLLAELKQDISIYRRCVFELREHRERETMEADPTCEDIHVSVSLKISHIVNGFANLRTLDAVPQQTDLFAGL